MAAVVGVILMALGIFIPEKFDIEAQEVIKTSLNEILAGVGALITLIGGWMAKDPV